MQMQPQPVGKSVFCDVACCNGQHGEHTVRIINNKPPAIQQQKKLGRNQCSALVAINKSIIA